MQHFVLLQGWFAGAQHSTMFKSMFKSVRSKFRI